MPSALTERGFALRPETEADVPFLLRLYISTRWEELSVTDWPDAQKIAFLESQFAAQRSYYLSHYAGAAFDVLEERGVPAGRLYLDRQADTLLVVDIALLPEWCGKGFGTAILKALMDTAARSGRGVSIFVEKFNPALRLYRRLGFGETRDVGMHLEMEWMPAGGTASLS